jgi:DNA-binding NarL/FixJ family response regulator/HPt (histidine-containing phosphotransfer) domain-containing protein
VVAAPLVLLLVEDQPADAKLVELAVRAEPAGRFEIHRVARVAEAVERLRTPGVGVVLTDLGLPDTSGTDGVRRLVAAAPDVPVVVLSGSADPDRVLGALRAGAVDFQVKGVFPPGHLGMVLERAVARHRFLTALADPNWRADLPGSAWSAVTEAAVVLLDGRVVLWTPAAAAYLRGVDTPTPTLPERLERAVLPSPNDPTPRDGGPGHVLLGECPVSKPTGERETVRFASRTIGIGPVQRTVIAISPVSAGPSPRRLRTSAPPPGVPPEPPALDPGGWASLVELAGGNPGFVDEMVGSFVPFAGGLVGDLRRAAGAHDPDALERAAHALKSSSSQVAALGLANLCERLELASRAQHPPDPAPSIAAIAAELQRVVEALNEARGRGTGSPPPSPDPPGA